MPGRYSGHVDLGAARGPRTHGNRRATRLDRRFTRNQNGKRKVVVIVRERDGNSVPAVFNSESQAASFIRSRIAKGTTVHADEASAWDHLHERFEVKRINHQEAYSFDGACTNWAAEYFSRLRRAEKGIHHHVAGPYLLRYAQESSWREDNRRVSNGYQTQRVAVLALKRGKSVDFTGYWQRQPVSIANATKVMKQVFNRIVGFCKNLFIICYGSSDKVGTWLMSVLACLALPCLPLLVELLKKGQIDLGNIMITASILSSTFIFTAGHRIAQVIYSLLFVIALLLDAVSGGLAEQMVHHYSGTLLAAVAFLHTSERFRWHVVLDRPFP
ncbi:uncharacterized protein YkuJ [Bradyrhizobium sp. USDA 4448]